MDSELATQGAHSGADASKQQLSSPNANVPGNDRLAAAAQSGGWFIRAIPLILMALATLGSAWCGFQAGLWNGIQTFRLEDANKVDRLSNQKVLLANQELNLDAVTFMEYSRALSENNLKLAEFTRDRMRPEFRPALDAWLATKPLQNPGAAASPFQMQEYIQKAKQEAQDADRSSSAMHDQAQQANLNGDSYGLAVLLFTSALFLAGLLTGIDETRTKWVVMFLSIVFVLLASYVVAGLPVAHRG